MSRNPSELRTPKIQEAKTAESMSNKKCELCSNPARILCESDQANLCWDCDEEVHAANFLVAKHCRTLLCHVCSSPTPWKAAGPTLGPTVSVCQTCVERGEEENRGNDRSSRLENENEDYDSQESESDDGEYYDDSDYYSEEDEEEEKEGENQVVPWSSCSDAPPSPPRAESYSASDEYVSFSSLKRMRDNHFECESEEGCCSSQDLDPKIAAYDLRFQELDTYVSSALTLSRPLKLQRTDKDSESVLSEQAAYGRSPVNSSSGTAAIVNKLRKFQREIGTESGNASATILDICKLTRDS